MVNRADSKGSGSKGSADVHARTVRAHAECAVPECGVCNLISCSYADQLASKQQRIVELFQDVVGEDCVLHPIAGMSDPWRFRHKIASPFAPAKAGKPRAGQANSRKGKRGRPAPHIACGMYAPGTHRIIEVPQCPAEHPSGRRVIQAVRHIMRKHAMLPYDEDKGVGFMRYVLVRAGYASGEVLVTLVTAEHEFPGAKSFGRELVKRCPEITTIVQNVNGRDTNAILGNQERTLYGPGFILDSLCGLSFRISSQSFYQVNPAQAEVLYTTALANSGIVDAAQSPGTPSSCLSGMRRVQSTLDAGTRESGAPGLSSLAPLGEPAASSVADETPTGKTPTGVSGAGGAIDAADVRASLIVDAYCGTGTIGLVAAAKAPGAHVVGVDKVASAIRDARQNAAHNGIENAEFVTADAGEYLHKLASRGVVPDVVFLDPPRAGASEQFLRSVLACGPQRVVYISCNPVTQVRDVRMLQEGGYCVKALQPVDMFPHTDHIENIALLVRSESL